MDLVACVAALAVISSLLSARIAFNPAFGKWYSCEIAGGGIAVSINQYGMYRARPTRASRRWEADANLHPAVVPRVAFVPIIDSGARWGVSFPLWSLAIWGFLLEYVRERPARDKKSSECRKCGYSLIGVADAIRCPECGEPMPDPSP